MITLLVLLLLLVSYMPLAIFFPRALEAASRERRFIRLANCRALL